MVTLLPNIDIQLKDSVRSFLNYLIYFKTPVYKLGRSCLNVEDYRNETRLNLDSAVLLGKTSPIKGRIFPVT